MNNILSNLPYIELPFSGPRFTWREKKSGDNNIHERLDRGLASTLWVSLFPQVRLIHHVFTSSDHYQIVLNYLPSNNSKAPPFRFEKMWCLRKDYETLVKKT